MERIGRRQFLEAASVLPWLRTEPERSLGSIAYIAGRELFIKRLPGGEAMPLASGGNLRAPRFSPSGVWLAYYDDDRIQLIRTDGSAKRSFARGRFRWLNRSDTLALVADDGVSLASEWNDWRLTEFLKEGDGAAPLFSPDDGLFVCVAASKGGAVLQLRAARNPASVERNLASSRAGDFVPGVWSRNGRHVFYWRSPEHSASLQADGLELCVANLQSGEDRSLQVLTLCHPEWIAEAPSAEMVVMVAGGGREAWDRKRIAPYRYATRQLQYLTDEKTAALAPAWSPDGRQLAFAASPAATNLGGGEAARQSLLQRRIYKLDVKPYSRPVALTADDRYRDEGPLWSADGGHILFGRIDRNNRASLWLMQAAGSDGTEIAGPLAVENGWFGYYGYIDWRECFDWRRYS